MCTLRIRGNSAVNKNKFRDIGQNVKGDRLKSEPKWNRSGPILIITPDRSQCEHSKRYISRFSAELNSLLAQRFSNLDYFVCARLISKLYSNLLSGGFSQLQCNYLFPCSAMHYGNSPRFEFTHSVRVVDWLQTLVLLGACIPFRLGPTQRIWRGRKTPFGTS